MTSQGLVKCWTETQMAAPSNSASGEGQALGRNSVLDAPLVEKRVFGQLAGVQADPDDAR